jgi:hypothetical protein
MSGMKRGVQRADPWRTPAASRLKFAVVARLCAWLKKLSPTGVAPVPPLGRGAAL